MKLATWNVQRLLPGTARRTAVEGWLRRIHADIWVLTETHDAISPDAAFTAVSTDVPDREGTPGERWAVIWSRYPIEALPPQRDPVRTVAALVHPTDAPPLVVYASVLPWLGSPWRGIPALGGEAFATALEAQRQDWIDLRGRFPGADMCVAGDLNQDLSDRHYYGSRRNRAALKAALASVNLVAVTADPTDPVRAIAPERAVIDHICLSADAARCVTDRGAWPTGDAPDRRLSDHYGIVISINEGSATT